MLRMTRQADYGILMLAQMAREPRGHVHSARDLAVAAELPLPTASKILKALARARLLESQRGANGGYRLSRAAAAISVAEVISALEGPIGVTECTAEGLEPCVHERNCLTRSPMHRINSAVRATLQKVSLADVAGPGPHNRVSIAV
ncbi:MAG: SUF system Fe-S cluster assembly regulator [Planctomycetota bacterium]|nr:MAG: SUF system Fe-S cluster assembly regulator [Planctomycetota bacterium]